MKKEKIYNAKMVKSRRNSYVYLVVSQIRADVSYRRLAIEKDRNQSIC